MSLRFFADHCIPDLVIQTLRSTGHEVLDYRTTFAPDSSDTFVILKAQDLDSILISLNADFSDIVTYPPRKYKGIIVLQVRNHPEIIPGFVKRLKDYLSTHNDMNYYKGKLTLVEVRRIRIRE